MTIVITLFASVEGEQITRDTPPFSQIGNKRIVFRVGEIGKPYFEVGNKRVDFKEKVGFGGRIVRDVRTVLLRGFAVTSEMSLHRGWRLRSAAIQPHAGGLVDRAAHRLPLHEISQALEWIESRDPALKRVIMYPMRKKYNG
jgi:hypothetical protein